MAANVRFGGAFQREDRARVLEEGGSCLSAAHLSRDPLHQGQAELFLQFVDSPGDGRLAHVDRFGRPSEAAVLGHRGEGAQQVQVHGNINKCYEEQRIVNLHSAA